MSVSALNLSSVVAERVPVFPDCLLSSKTGNESSRRIDPAHLVKSHPAGAVT